MAEAIVSMVLESFKSLLVDETKFLSAVGDQVEHAQVELHLMRGYLKDADAKQGDDELVRIWVGIIRDAAYDLEDIMESFVLKVASRRKGGIKFVVKRWACILNEANNLHKIGSGIENIATKLSKLRSSLEGYHIARQSRGSVSATSFERQQDNRLTYSHVDEQHFVGLKKEREQLAAQLVTQKKQVVLIWGMGGLWKTPLARKVYKHTDIRHHFDCFAWVCVTQKFQKVDVWKNIFVQLTSDADKDKERKRIANMTTDEIAEELCVLQRKKKCLVVLDDIWTYGAWKSLRAGFPMNEETGSRVIITSRNKGVVSEANESVYFHPIRPLDDSESRELFKKIVTLTKSEVDREKEKLGDEMLKHCGGSPLAITVLAGILATKETVDDWKTVKKNVGAYIWRGTDLESRYKDENSEGTSSVLALSYESLPYHLKPCFLYLAHFPEGREIPVKRLIQLWIAEGFIYSAPGELMEDVAYNCLNELVLRCMVQVRHRGSTNKIKSCRLRELVRDLCVSKAKDENFVNTSNSFATQTPVTPSDKVRRHAIYLGKSGENLIPPTDCQVRSLLYFMSENLDMGLNGKPIRPRFQNFKLLRVLSLEEFKGEVELPSTIGKLVHLRFFSLKGCVVTRFPSSISKLICLQTLDLRCFRHIDMKRGYRNLHNVIQHLGQLRHLYLPAMKFRVAGNTVLSLATLGNLQTLVNVSNCDCVLSDLAGLASLRKMSIDMVLPLEDEMKIVDSVTIESNYLQSLSLRSSTEVEASVRILLSCHNIYKLQLEGPIAELQKDLLDYPNLAKIKLYRTFLKDKHIKILEQLPHLKILWLQDVALEIPTLVFSKQGFPCLEFLSISGVSQLKEWRVEEGAMHSLRKLQIKCCLELKEVPDGLRHTEKLEKLIVTMPPDFCSALQEGGKDFDKIKHVASVKLDRNDTNLQMLEKMEAEKVANVSAGTSAMPPSHKIRSKRNKRPDWEASQSEESTGDGL